MAGREQGTARLPARVRSPACRVRARTRRNDNVEIKVHGASVVGGGVKIAAGPGATERRGVVIPLTGTARVDVTGSYTCAHVRGHPADRS